MVDFGDNRRLWLHVATAGMDIRVCIVYLKCGKSLDEDTSWMPTLDGLEKEIEYIRNTYTECILLMGDFNLQPVSLGGEVDPRSRRQPHWCKFIKHTDFM